MRGTTTADRLRLLTDSLAPVRYHLRHTSLAGTNLYLPGKTAEEFVRSAVAAANAEKRYGPEVLADRADGVVSWWDDYPHLDDEVSGPAPSGGMYTPQQPQRVGGNHASDGGVLFGAEAADTLRWGPKKS